MSNVPPRIPTPPLIRVAAIGGALVAALMSWLAAAATGRTSSFDDAPIELFLAILAAAITVTVLAVILWATFSVQQQIAIGQRRLAEHITTARDDVMSEVEKRTQALGDDTADLAKEVEQLNARLGNLYWGAFADGANAVADATVVPMKRPGS